MAGAVERIERDLAALEEAIARIAEELQRAYSNYLSALGQALKQQLILASYHLCTQGYPEAFLRMSFSQRQQLQQALRQIAVKAKEDLLTQLDSPSPTAWEAIQEALGGNLEELVPPVSPEKPTHPAQLLQWQARLEEAIARILQGVSRDSNRLLQQNDILSKRFPEPLLEAAAKVETPPEGIAGPPNLLNLVIESDNNPESQTASVTHIIAIHLRLAEIEFTDPTVMTHRHQIRNLSGKLNNLDREYQKKQRERTVAEAEAAWRSTWFED